MYGWDVVVLSNNNTFYYLRISKLLGYLSKQPPSFTIVLKLPQKFFSYFGPPELIHI